MAAEDYKANYATAREKEQISWKRKLTFDISASPTEELKSLHLQKAEVKA